jgi:hypothetical protein
VNRLRRAAIAVTVGTAMTLGSGCAVTGDGYAYGNGYGYDNNPQFGMDYYEPYGGAYGEWGPGYRVGPFHEGGHHWERGGGARPSPHAYRPAPPSRAVPSIPSRSRAAGVRPR